MFCRNVLFFITGFEFQFFRSVAKSPDGVPKATNCLLVTLYVWNCVQPIYCLQLLEIQAKSACAVTVNMLSLSICYQETLTWWRVVSVTLRDRQLAAWEGSDDIGVRYSALQLHIFMNRNGWYFYWSYVMGRNLRCLHSYLRPYVLQYISCKHVSDTEIISSLAW
jgi:hypothetical protein